MQKTKTKEGKLQEWEELVNRAKNKDKEAFTELIRRIRNDLYKVAKSKLSKEEDIQEVIQLTMIKAYRKLHQLKEPSKFKNWIETILTNNCKAKYKERMKQSKRYENFDESIAYIPDSEHMEKIEKTMDFNAMIKDLTSEERQIIILTYNERYTSKEIANYLGLNENTVKSKLRRAKEKIRTKYNRK